MTTEFVKNKDGSYFLVKKYPIPAQITEMNFPYLNGWRLFRDDDTKLFVLTSNTFWNFKVKDEKLLKQISENGSFTLEELFQVWDIGLTEDYILITEASQ